MKGDRGKERVGMEGVEGDEEKRREKKRREEKQAVELLQR